MENSEFYKKVYALSNSTKRLDFFDKIKQKFGDWFDINLAEYGPEVELVELRDNYDSHWLSVKIKTNKSMEELNPLYDDFERVFEEGVVLRGLHIDISDMIDTHGYTEFNIFER